MIRLLITITILCTLSRPLSAQVQVINLAESTSNWGRDAMLTEDAYEGGFAIAYDLPNDRTGFLSFNHLNTGVDLSKFKRIAFWWKVEGDGLREFKIKVRNYPLVGGMEAVYTLHEVGEAPKTWTLAVAEIAAPHYDDWGGEPDLERRYITFRTVTDTGSNVRLFIDRIVALTETFSWETGTPNYDPTAGPDTRIP